MAVSAVSLANLRPAKPGEVRNPLGRPKSKPISDGLRKILEDPEELGKFLRAVLDKAQDGDVQAAHFVCDHIEGKVGEKLELTGADGGPVEVVGMSLDQRLELARQQQELIESSTKLLKSA